MVDSVDEVARFWVARPERSDGRGMLGRTPFAALRDVPPPRATPDRPAEVLSRYEFQQQCRRKPTGGPETRGPGSRRSSCAGQISQSTAYHVTQAPHLSDSSADSRAELPPLPARCWYLTGPTASGKTAIGIELARRLGAEIISLDSMAVYRRMDIGTAKPTAKEQSAVPHHLIDLIDPHEEFSLAQYVHAAHRVVAEIEARGREPLLVGGTPLYLKALLRGIFQGPPADWNFRRELEGQRAAHGPDWLHARLAAVDPVSAARLHPNDARRLIRALEVHHLTGTPISALQRQFDLGRPANQCRVFLLDWPRRELYDRINQRVQTMFADGLVEEAVALLDSGQPPGRTARQALGYREVFEHLAGQRDLPATIDLLQRRTRQFARRQLTWFRSLSECRPVEMSPDATTIDITRHILRVAMRLRG